MRRAASLVLCCVFCLLPLEKSFLPAAQGLRAAAAPTVSSDSLRTDFSDYIWPTDAGTIITSTFAEFRTLHFHGGIDISTGDHTGYQVFASRDGYISRIFVSPTGYGKMLFVRHRDGYTTVYAHLSRFAPTINLRTAQEQRRCECYPIDIRCDSGEFPVRKGELIAYTGDTGIGSPHLHFEIRDENLDAVNPQLAEHIRISDGIAPTINKIAITPLGERARVHGGWETQVYRASPDGPNRYRISEIVNVTGSTGIAVNVRDRTEGSRFQRGVYRNSLYMDDRLIYSVARQRAPMRNAHQVGLYYDWDLFDRGQGRFEKLYAEGSGPHPFLPAGTVDAGIINSAGFPDGRHSFRIVCEDIAGNRSEVNGALVFNHPPIFRMETTGSGLVLRFPDPASIERILISTARAGVTGWSLHATIPQRDIEGNFVRVPLPAGDFDVVKIVAQNIWGTNSIPRFHFVRTPSSVGQSFALEHSVKRDFVRLVAKTSGMFTVPPTVLVYEGEKRRVVPMEPTDVDTYVGSFKPSDTFAGPRQVSAEAEVNGRHSSALEEFSIFPIIPGRSGTFKVDDGKLVLTYDSLSAYSPLYMEIEKEVVNGETSYTLLPRGTVLGGSLQVGMTADAGVLHQGLYYHGRNGHDLLASLPTGNMFQGRIARTLGDLYLAVDDSPPSVSQLNLSVSHGRPAVAFRVSDDGSGIEYDDLKMYIDGDVAIPEIDGEHRRVQYQASDPLERGSHLLTIRLKDRAGNSSSVEQRFSVR